MTGAEQLSKAILESGDSRFGWSLERVHMLTDYLQTLKSSAQTMTLMRI